MGGLTVRLTSTRSTSPPPFATKRRSAVPTRGDDIGKRTSIDSPGERSTVFFGGPWTITPSAASSTSTDVFERPFDVTTTPASTVSPARKKRGSAGRAMSGRLVVTYDWAYP